MHDDDHQSESQKPRSSRGRRLRERREPRGHLTVVPSDEDALRLVAPATTSRTMGRLIAQTALMADTATAPGTAQVGREDPPPVRERRPRRDRGRFGWFL